MKEPVAEPSSRRASSGRVLLTSSPRTPTVSRQPWSPRMPIENFGTPTYTSTPVRSHRRAIALVNLLDNKENMQESPRHSTSVARQALVDQQANGDNKNNNNNNEQAATSLPDEFVIPCTQQRLDVEQLLRENMDLRRTVAQQKKIIAKLTDVVRASNLSTSESDSKYEKSTTSTTTSSSRLPIGRVTPSKRDERGRRVSPRTPSTSFSRSYNRSTVSALAGSDQAALSLGSSRRSERTTTRGSSGSNLTPTARNTPPPPLQPQNIGSYSPIRPPPPAVEPDAMLAELPSPNRHIPRGMFHRNEERPVGHLGRPAGHGTTPVRSQTFVIPRHTSSGEVLNDQMSQMSISSNTSATVSSLSYDGDEVPRAREPVQQPIAPRSVIIEGLGLTPEQRDCGWKKAVSPGYYLRLRRPEFIENLSRRQETIKVASETRQKVEKRRRKAALAVVQGACTVNRARSALFADATAVKAFPVNQMKALTKRNLIRSDDYQKTVRRNLDGVEDDVRHLIGDCYKHKMQTRRFRSKSQPAPPHR